MGNNADAVFIFSSRIYVYTYINETKSRSSVKLVNGKTEGSCFDTSIIGYWRWLTPIISTTIKETCKYCLFINECLCMKWQSKRMNKTKILWSICTNDIHIQNVYRNLHRIILRFSGDWHDNFLLSFIEIYVFYIKNEKEVHMSSNWPMFYEILIHKLCIRKNISNDIYLKFCMYHFRESKIQMLWF